MHALGFTLRAPGAQSVVHPISTPRAPGYGPNLSGIRWLVLSRAAVLAGRLWRRWLPISVISESSGSSRVCSSALSFTLTVACCWSSEKTAQHEKKICQCCLLAGSPPMGRAWDAHRRGQTRMVCQRYTDRTVGAGIVTPTDVPTVPHERTFIEEIAYDYTLMV